MGRRKCFLMGRICSRAACIAPSLEERVGQDECKVDAGSPSRLDLVRCRCDREPVDYSGTKWIVKRDVNRGGRLFRTAN